MEDNPHEASGHHAKPHHGSYGQSGKVIKPTEPSSIDGTEDPETSVPVHRSTHSEATTHNEAAHSEFTSQQAYQAASPPPEPFPESFPPIDVNPLPPAPPPPPALPVESVTRVEGGDPDHPIAVAEVYSTYGLEYILMFISLAAAAISFTSLLNAIIDLTMNKSSGTLIGSLLNPYAEATLIVSFPIFAFLFLRLESKEEVEPSLMTDASRRRGMQITLIISFIVALGGLIGYIGGLFSKAIPAASNYYGSGVGSSSSGFATFLHALVDLLVAGAIFGYYWYKLHKKSNQNWQ